MSAATDLPFASPGMEIADEPDVFAADQPDEVWDYGATEGMSPEEQAELAETQEAVAQAAAVAAVVTGAAQPGTQAAAAAPTAPTTSSTAFPAFEGLAVRETTVKLNGEGKVESLAGLVVSIDDRVRLVGEFKVIGVNHKVDNKTGEVIREMVFKASNLELAPWDPADPTDDGVLRARPSAP